MRFDQPLVEGRLVRRYKRFLADVDLASEGRVTAHCPNTGSLLGCADPGCRVWLSHRPDPRRRYPYTWELAEAEGGALVGIHTGRSNALVREAVEQGVAQELAGYDQIRGEVRFGTENSRVDLLLTGSKTGRDCYLEVKNVTAAVSGGVALFPDAVTARGTKHLRELAGVVDRGHRAVLCFCVQRADAHEVRPADAIDPAYGRTLREAMAAGVEALAYRASVSLSGIHLAERIPVVCP